VTFWSTTVTRRYLRAILLTRRIHMNKSITDSYVSDAAMMVRPCLRASLFLDATVPNGAAISRRSSTVSLIFSRSRDVRSLSSMCLNRTSHR
jgi:hypothetical protein